MVSYNSTDTVIFIGANHEVSQPTLIAPEEHDYVSNYLKRIPLTPPPMEFLNPLKQPLWGMVSFPFSGHVFIRFHHCGVGVHCA